MDLVSKTRARIEESGRELRFVGAVVPQVKMWAVFEDGQGGIECEQVLWLNQYVVLTDGREDFVISVPVIAGPDGMGLEEVDGYHEALLGVSVGKVPDPELWAPRAPRGAS